MSKHSFTETRTEANARSSTNTASYSTAGSNVKNPLDTTIRHGMDFHSILSTPIGGTGHSFTETRAEADTRSNTCGNMPHWGNQSFGAFKEEPTSMASIFANATMETVVNRNDYFDQRNDPLTTTIVHDSGYQGLPCNRHLPNRGGQAVDDEFEISESQDNSNYESYPNPSDEQTSNVSELGNVPGYELFPV